jgi:AhpC/TSA family
MVRRMTRTGAIVLLTTGLVLTLVVLWMGGGLVPGPSGPSGSARPATSLAGSGDLDAHFRALNIVPLDGAPAATFALPALAGQRVSLADFAGRPVLLYFWATW